MMSPATHEAPEPEAHPSKRARQSTPDGASPGSGQQSAVAIPDPVSPVAESTASLEGSAQGSKVGQSSSFRNVSACNRCRLRKNRCDQKLPSCESCSKARVACVGYDPITKREIPRSYVFYIESRVEQLEALLRANGISYPPADDLEYSSKAGAATDTAKTVAAEGGQGSANDAADASSSSRPQHGDGSPVRPRSSKQRSSSHSKSSGGQANGVSFARVVFAAVQSSVSDHKSISDKGAVRPYKPIAGNGAMASGTSMRDSFFGLHTKPTISPAELPSEDLARRLIDLYFEHANPQIPVLHRVDFMHMFERAYADEGRARGPKELYMLNMVFAIGGGIIMDEKTTKMGEDRHGSRRRQAQPEEYHASAIVHLEACLSSSGGGLEELQAVLLLANFALLRPVPPGLWYIVGVAVRLAVDLGLHYEDGKDLARNEAALDAEASDHHGAASRERGRREYIRDLRRRLWWCTYAFDRLVSTCVGRPFGISDQVITTEFPSIYEDRYITPAGISLPPGPEPTYKVVAYHYLRLRLLQSEILQVLQYQHAQIARSRGQNQGNAYVHSQLSSPFLSRFPSFRAWRIDIDRRLWEWKNDAPEKADSGVLFSVEFLELNYWQALILLYRQSLDVPAVFQKEYNTSKEVNSPMHLESESIEDEERVYLKVAEAGQRIIRIYRQLHLIGLVNYTYLATHHLFMAGISYLYAIWYSPVVRSRLTMDEVDFTILAATSVFTDLIDKCPPAEACRDAFDRTAKTTLRMANASGGFGAKLAATKRGSKVYHDRVDYFSASGPTTTNRQKPHHARPAAAAEPRSTSQYGAEAFPSGNAQDAATFQLSMAGVKTEPDVYPVIPPLTSDLQAAPATAHDSILMNSPTAMSVQSPLSVASLTSGSANPAAAAAALGSASAGGGGGGGPALNYMQSPTGAFTPMSFSDLQGMEMMRGLQQSGSLDDGNGGGDMVDFGLGWEGIHHDYNDGAQIDLFDGFFFGGQQGTGGQP